MSLEGSKFHQGKSRLFNIKDVPPIDKDESKVHISHSFRIFKPSLAHQLEKNFTKIRSDEAEFSDGSILSLSGEASNVVMPWVMAGGNLVDAMWDMYIANSLTQRRGPFGPNVDRFSVLTLYGEMRQDLASKKDLPPEMLAKFTEEELKEIQPMALVMAQSSWTEPLADLMKNVVKVDTHVMIDSHSFPAKEQFEAVGIETINITTAKLMVENLTRNGFLKDNLETMIVGVDFGNLALAKKLSDEEGFSLGIIRKHRVPNLSGGPSRTEHELVYGDVRGKRVILMDDMISSGGTILKTIKLLLQNGAAEVIVCASHAVFAGRDYYEQLQEVLLNDRVKIVMVSDTLPLDRPAKGGDKSQPYVLVPGRNGKPKRREVAMLKVDDFIAYVVAVMLANPSTEGINRAMGEHVLPQVDSFDLYHQITGKKVPRPVVVASYREGGIFKFIEEKILNKLRKQKFR